MRETERSEYIRGVLDGLAKSAVGRAYRDGFSDANSINAPDWSRTALAYRARRLYPDRDTPGICVRCGHHARVHPTETQADGSIWTPCTVGDEGGPECHCAGFVAPRPASTPEE